MARIEEVASWKIIPTQERMLHSLLRNNADKVACKFSDFYILEATIELFLFAIKNQNEIFIKHSLLDNVFASNMLTDPQLIEELLTNIESGISIEL